MSDDRLSGSLQENILCLIVFDKKYATLARQALTVQHFESALFREVAGIAIDYLDKYGEPVADHLPDHLEGPLKDKEDSRRQKSYERVVTDLFAARDTINGEYVITQLHKFVRQQTIKSTVRTIVECMEDGRIEDAEVAMQKGLNSNVVSFEPGVDLSNPAEALAFLDHVEKPYLMGVSALDRYGIGPAPKTVFLLAGPLGKGKSWGLGHIGKYGLLQRKRVCHITLEMSEHKTVGRYMQSLFSVAKRQGPVRVPRLTKDFDGSIKTVDFDELNLPTLEDANIRSVLSDRIKRRLVRKHIRIKKFPSGVLTMPMLRAYLDGLERFEGFVPEILIIDYAELMYLDPKDLRGSIGRLFVELRGLADERNLALATAAQVNREGINRQTSDETNMAEDISKAFTADIIVTYNQTDLEKKMGLARLFVAKNRDDEGRMSALITQSYASGQFCIDSAPMNDRYLPSLRPRADDEEEDKDEGPRRRTRS